MSSAVDNDTSGPGWPQLSACKVVSSSVTGLVSLLVITHYRVKFTEDTGHYRIRFTALSSQNVGASS